MEAAQNGADVILVRPETSPEDVGGMLMSKGLLTQHGGATSHAAVVARGSNLPCVAGAEGISINTELRQFTVGDIVIKEGDVISVDGTDGSVFKGAITTEDVDFSKEVELATILSWADKYRRLKVYMNADYPRDAQRGIRFGAQGIGLCRTEHMFFERERRPFVVGMIMAKNNDALRKEYLEKLLPFQRSDFEGIFEAMNGLPTVIRLIDPPMHEFLPKREQLIEEVTQLRCNGGDPKELEEKLKMLELVESLWEANPMMGLRGCRVGIMMPGVTEMQVRAIFEEGCRVTKRGIKVAVEIMIPLVGHPNELRLERETGKVAKTVMAEEGIEIPYMFGTISRSAAGCLVADELAQYAEFFSFGTNDLTQMTFGYSRDDAEESSCATM